MIKLLTAVIRTHRLDAVRDALVEAGVAGMTVTEVRGVDPRTGEPGDGKLWITDVDRVVRIRTGERGVDALG